MTWQKHFAEGKELTLCTTDANALPHANIVISLGLVEDKLLIADCQMVSTIENLQRQPQCCIIGGYVRIKGEATLYAKGKYVELAQKKSPGYTVRHAILVEVKEKFDLDKGVAL